MATLDNYREVLNDLRQRKARIETAISSMLELQRSFPEHYGPKASAVICCRICDVPVGQEHLPTCDLMGTVGEVPMYLTRKEAK